MQLLPAASNAVTAAADGDDNAVACNVAAVYACVRWNSVFAT